MDPEGRRDHPFSWSHGLLWGGEQEEGGEEKQGRQRQLYVEERKEWEIVAVGSRSLLLVEETVGLQREQATGGFFIVHSVTFSLTANSAQAPLVPRGLGFLKLL